MKRILIIVFVLACSGISGLVVSTKLAMRELPDNLFELTQGDVRAKLLDRHGQPLTITFQNRWNVHDQVSLHEIPSLLQNAFLLAEDKRFYRHSGIDWLARFKAILQNVMALEAVRGASTVSEQVVRMINIRERSIWSRWVEGWEARELEQYVDKESILEFYLNQVPYAAQRRGVHQAARYYFDRDLNTLSEKEMLSLAVLVRAPSRFDLYKSTSRIEGRLNRLIDRVSENGLIENAQEIKSAILSVRRTANLPEASHFARHVYRSLKNRSVSSQHSSQVIVKTTLDSHLQTVANNLLNDRLRQLADKNVDNAGMIVVDHIDNEVLAWSVGNTGRSVGTQYDTILTKRQPGSTLKPFVYAAAMSKGWQASTMIDDSPLSEGVGRGVHQYRNYSHSYYGPISVRKALANSLNIPAIKAAKFVGLSPLLTTFSNLGLTELDLRSVDYGNGIALGNGEISLYSMTRAYAVLARNGAYQDFKFVGDASLAKPKYLFSAEVTSLLANILSDDEARSLEFGRGGALHFPVQTAVKTGTSNDYRDAWVFGFNHRYLVGVWMGNLSSEAMLGITGSKGPALVMRSMFSELNKRQATKPLFLSPRLVQRDVCIESGKLAGPSCASRSEYFIHSTEMSSKESSIESQGLGSAQEFAFDDISEANGARYADAQSLNTSEYQLLSPIDQTQMAYDPRIPLELQLAEFKLNTVDNIQRAEWFVNDELLALNRGEPYMWPIERGQHKVTVKVFRETAAQPIILNAVYLVK